MSYDAIPSDLHRQAASYVDRILKGAKPSELPVQQPARFELAVNLKNRKSPRPHHTAHAPRPRRRGDRMRRREFVTWAATAVLGCPTNALAQQPRMLRVARLSPLSREADAPMIKALLAGLKERGWIDGQNFTFEGRFADGDEGRLARLAAELVALKVDVIVTGSNPGALAAKNLTSEIPVVFVTTGDPISGGLVTSSSSPGGKFDRRNRARRRTDREEAGTA